MPDNEIIVQAIKNEKKVGHDLVKTYPYSKETTVPKQFATRILNNNEDRSFYSSNFDYVGIKLTQKIKKNKNSNNEDYELSDRNLFSKVDQALVSTVDLINNSIKTNDKKFIEAIFPVLVVPDDTLCVEKYDDNNESRIEKCEIIPYNIGKVFSELKDDKTFNMSKALILTIKGLEEFFDIVDPTDSSNSSKKTCIFSNFLFENKNEKPSSPLN